MPNEDINLQVGLLLPTSCSARATPDERISDGTIFIHDDLSQNLPTNFHFSMILRKKDYDFGMIIK